MIEYRILAVLTGDIVDSSGLRRAGLEHASALIEEAGESVIRQFPGLVHARIDVFRGDSWQMVVVDPASSIRIGLYFRSFLKAQHGVDSRVSIGFGPVDYLPMENISTGTGMAFSLSGQGLLECIKPVRMILKVPNPEIENQGKGFNIITRLIDLQVGRWTQSQSQAIAGALKGMTQAEIASRWQPRPVSQQAISQHLDSAGWSQIRGALSYLEESLPAALDSGLLMRDL